MRLRLGRYSKLKLDSPGQDNVIPIAGDAAIATTRMGDGRLIPLLILDTTERPDIAEVIRSHAHFAAGDVVVQWGELPKRRDHVTLLLRFLRPIERMALIEFDIARQGILVEHILASHALYLQAGKAGDRLIHDFNLPKMLVEIPDTGFRPHWNKRYLDGVIKRMRKEGLSRREAKEAAKMFIEEIRKLGQLRMKEQVISNNADTNS